MPADFVALVLASADVTDVIGDRIFPGEVPPQTWDGPDRRACLVYTSDVLQPGRTFDSTDTLLAEEFTVTAQALTYDDARELARRVIAAVLDFSGVSGGSDIQRVFLDFEYDSPQFEAGIKERVVRFTVWYRSN